MSITIPPKPPNVLLATNPDLIYELGATDTGRETLALYKKYLETPMMGRAWFRESIEPIRQIALQMPAARASGELIERFLVAPNSPPGDNEANQFYIDLNKSYVDVQKLLDTLELKRVMMDEKATRLIDLKEPLANIRVYTNSFCEEACNNPRKLHDFMAELDTTLNRLQAHTYDLQARYAAESLSPNARYSVDTLIPECRHAITMTRASLRGIKQVLHEPPEQVNIHRIGGDQPIPEVKIDLAEMEQAIHDGKVHRFVPKVQSK